MAHPSTRARSQIKKMLDWSNLHGPQRAARRKELEALSATEVAEAYRLSKQAMASQAPAQQTPPRRRSKPAATGTRTSRKSKKLPEGLKKRAQRLVAAIKSGKIKAKSGKTKPSDYKGTARERYDKFVALYKGIRIPAKGKKSSGPKAPGIKEVYDSLPARGKKPYYLSAGYHVNAFNVGGGKKGPGIVRTIPGSGATPFSKLSEAEKKKVIKFLNTKNGKKLRTKGAPGTASLTEMERVAKQKAAAKKKKGSKSWW